mmetsp:Transcript_29917/g.63049  ORF Transcript_29917/g.63049 Transcript_29917/m.63049 type:complete len:200 (+) Transcript_29917:170-769(+)
MSIDKLNVEHLIVQKKLCSLSFYKFDENHASLLRSVHGIYCNISSRDGPKSATPITSSRPFFLNATSRQHHSWCTLPLSGLFKAFSAIRMAALLCKYQCGLAEAVDSVNTRPMVNEQSCDFSVALHNCAHERRTAAHALNVWISLRIEELTNTLQVASESSTSERCVSGAWSNVWIIWCSSMREQVTNNSDMALFRCEC